MRKRDFVFCKYPDHNGSYTIKTYTSEKAYDREIGQWQHGCIVLKPLNLQHNPIVIEEDDNFTVVGDYRIYAIITEKRYLSQKYTPDG